MPTSWLRHASRHSGQRVLKNNNSGCIQPAKPSAISVSLAIREDSRIENQQLANLAQRLL